MNFWFFVLKKIIGIETSCDDTSVAILGCTIGSDVLKFGKLFSNLLYRQSIHSNYGGIVPEVASRFHLDVLPKIYKDACVSEFDYIAVTSHPGLIGSLIVGVMFAKGLSLSLGKPIIRINHLQGHALSARMENPALDFPFILLLVSGGHSQILIVEDVCAYSLLGETLDDALGETYDKVARMLGLGYPGGPEIELRAINGDCNKFKLPKPMYRQPGCDFSFSGLKTAVKLLIESLGREPTCQDTCDISASFQGVVDEVIKDRLTNAIKIAGGVKSLVVAGGVASNKQIRNVINDLCNKFDIEFYAPSKEFCVDNGAMIAWAGAEMISKYGSKCFSSLDFPASARCSSWI